MVLYGFILTLFERFMIEHYPLDQIYLDYKIMSIMR